MAAVVSLPTDVKAAVSNPASSSATALSARLAAPLPKPSSHSPAQDSVATPDEMEERLRFYARQIKSFRRTCLLHSFPELRERIRQMEEDYKTAVRQFYCRTPSPTPSHQSAAAEQSKPGLQNGAAGQPTSSLRSTAAVQPTPGLQGPGTEQPTSGLPRASAVQPTSGLQSTAAVQPRSPESCHCTAQVCLNLLHTPQRTSEEGHFG
ncbi:hypothetical protein AMECASPLE_017888 [Ameca splendens]|uniref:Uncharacterized protein n=1 Tax=Ameca splendens TaxID=208324 RepID=A0ABV0YE46_9TELE